MQLLDYYLIDYAVLGFVIACFGVMYNIVVVNGIARNIYEKLDRKLHPELMKPLGVCEKCFSGQVALWSTIAWQISLGFEWLSLVVIVLVCSVSIAVAKALTE